MPQESALGARFLQVRRSDPRQITTYMNLLVFSEIHCLDGFDRGVVGVSRCSRFFGPDCAYFFCNLFDSFSNEADCLHAIAVHLEFGDLLTSEELLSMLPVLFESVTKNFDPTLSFMAGSRRCCRSAHMFCKWENCIL